MKSWKRMPFLRHPRGEDLASGHLSFRPMERLFEKLVDRFMIPFFSAADLGCGPGLFARYLSRRWRVPVFALDPSRAMLRLARRNCSGENVRLFRLDLRAMKFPSPVDLVTAHCGRIHHLVHPLDLGIALERIAANLRPGGHFLFDFRTQCRPFPAHRFCSHAREVAPCARWGPGQSTRPLLSIESPFLLSGGGFTLEDMGKALGRARLAVRELLDPSTLRPATACTPRLLVVATRARE